MNANLRENLRRSEGLIGFDPDLVSSNLLALLAQDVDDVEGSATGQRNSYQFDGLSAGIAVGIVEEDVVSATAGSNELPMSANRLSQRNFSRNHAFSVSPRPNAVFGKLLQQAREKNAVTAEGLQGLFLEDFQNGKVAQKEDKTPQLWLGGMFSGCASTCIEDAISKAVRAVKAALSFSMRVVASAISPYRK
jgi:hypothetical protein